MREELNTLAAKVRRYFDIDPAEDVAEWQHVAGELVALTAVTAAKIPSDFISAKGEVVDWNERTAVPTKRLEDLPVCLLCGHSNDTNKYGICQTQMGSRNWAYCLCKCEFPVPAAEESEKEHQ